MLQLQTAVVIKKRVIKYETSAHISNISGDESVCFYSGFGSVSRSGVSVEFLKMSEAFQFDFVPQAVFELKSPRKRILVV